MAAGIGAVHVKRERGVMVVVGRGQTPRGKSYVKKVEVLKAKKSSDPTFKAELATAIAKMFSESPATP